MQNEVFEGTIKIAVLRWGVGVDILCEKEDNLKAWDSQKGLVSQREHSRGSLHNWF